MFHQVNEIPQIFKFYDNTQNNAWVKGSHSLITQTHSSGIVSHGSNYYRKQMKLRESNVFTGVCLVTGRGCISACTVCSWVGDVYSSMHLGVCGQGGVDRWVGGWGVCVDRGCMATSTAVCILQECILVKHMHTAKWPRRNLTELAIPGQEIRNYVI